MYSDAVSTLVSTPVAVLHSQPSENIPRWGIYGAYIDIDQAS
jgi:hypothetical protein